MNPLEVSGPSPRFPLVRRLERFGRLLLAIMFVGLAVRVSYVAVGVERACENRGLAHDCLLGDQIFYNAAANRLAQGAGFVEPFAPGNVFRPSDEPAADHPPLMLLAYAPMSWLAEHPPVEWIDDNQVGSHARIHRLWSAMLGTLTVGLIGLLGRRIGGDRVGLVAAGIAAISPGLWINDGLVMSESITNVVVVGALIATYDYLAKPNRNQALILGAMCGLCAMARAELLLFCGLLVVPAAAIARRGDGRAARRDTVAAAAMVVLVVGPWVVYNNIRFEERTFISTNDGLAIAGSNCDAVYSGSAIGLTVLADDCNGTGAGDFPNSPRGDQSEQARVWRTRAFDYMGDHLGRLPAVVAARIGRTWGVFRPYDMVAYNEGEGRPRGITRVATTLHFVMLAIAVVGWWIMRRGRKHPTGPLIAPMIVVTMGAALTYGQARFRGAAEPSLAVLAAFAVVAVTARIAERNRANASEADQGSRQAETA